MSAITAPTLRAQVDSQLARQRARSGWRFWLSEIVGAVFSFETLYVLFIFSGTYKSDPRLAWVPGDLTGILFGASVLAGVVLILRGKLKVSREGLILLLLFLAFVLWMYATMLWSPSVFYAQRKATLFPALTGWTIFAAAFIIAPDRHRLRRFFAMLTTLALYVSWESFYALRENFLTGNFRVLIRALGSHYGTLGVLIGNGVLLLLLYMLYFARRTVAKLALGALMLLIMVLLLFMGSRTSLTFPILASIVPLALTLRWRPPATPLKLLRTVALLVVVIVGVMMLWGKLVDMVPGGPATIRRFATLGRRGLESEGRFRNMYHGLRVTSQATMPQLVFGHGVGSWPLLLGVEDEQLYPHNIVIETVVELGLVGLVLLTLFTWHAVRTLGPLSAIRRDRMRIFVLTLAFSFLVVASVSGDLHENRAFFMFLGLMICGVYAAKPGVYTVEARRRAALVRTPV